MLFGADRIPEIARGLGKGMRQIKDATNDVKREINKTVKDNGLDTEFIDDIKKEVNKTTDGINKTFDDVTGPIKRGLK